MTHPVRRPIAANTWIWTSPLTDENIGSLARRIAELGFDAIEVPLENPGDWDPGLTAHLFAAQGLTPVVVAAMGPNRSLVARAGDVEATGGYLRTCIRAAARVGASVVGGPIYAPTGSVWRMDAAERAEVGAELRRNLVPLAAEAADAGVTLAIEPLNRYETSVINTVDQALDLLGPVLGPGLGLLLDTYHLNIEERQPVDAIRLAAGAIAHVQVCGSDRGPVGPDHTDWPGILTALDDVGYEGILGVESFTSDNATIAVAASIWRPLAPTQDVLARDSLRYLRRLADS
jgi:D-psicose/D-tagatose/L-ribulose 3-epimerase